MWVLYTFNQRAYYFGDVARLCMWCTCMFGGHYGAQPKGRWCVCWEANQSWSFSGRIEESFISKDSTQEKLESMYLSISFCLDISSLASLMCRNRLDCLGYKYIPPSIVKGFITRSTNKLYFLPAIYFSATSPLFFSFRRVLSSWSRTHHIRATWSAGKFSFTE